MIKLLLKLINSPLFKTLAIDVLIFLINLVRKEKETTTDRDKLDTLTHIEETIQASINDKKQNSI